jgi:hypothetical protein
MERGNEATPRVISKYQEDTMKQHQSTISRLAALAAAAMLCGTPQLASANLVTNGGFETGNLSGWNLSPSWVFDFVCFNGQAAGAATCSANTGTYAMTFGRAGGLDTLSQVVTTTAGAAYNLSFWLRNNNPLGSATEEFDVLWNGASVLALGPGAVAGFAYTENTFTVTGTGSDTLSFVARHDPSQWFLDDVSLEASVPEPASLALVAVALAAGGMRRRRKGA